MKKVIDKIKSSLLYFSKTGHQEAPYVSFNKSRQLPPHAYVCYAPWTSINFNIDGHVNVCCLNKKTSENIRHKSIDEIWNSDSFNTLRKQVAAGHLEYDCAICMNQIRSGQHAGVKALDYDKYIPHKGSFPVVMEFCLENTCNLACIMCNSLLSSTIRKNHKLPPLEKYYNDAFIGQLEPYIPHLKEAIFSGGEPFLIPLYYKIWERILAINPDVLISIITNGTVLNEKIKGLLERGRFRINISIDAVDKQLYESIRIHADFDMVMRHFEWFKEYGQRKGLPVNIPVCPMTVNWKNIPDIVRFANQHHVNLNFVYVDRPFSLALQYSPSELLDKIIDYYTQQIITVTTDIGRTNVKRFYSLIEDLKKWKNASLRSDKTPANDSPTVVMQWKQKIITCTEPEIIGRGDIKQELIDNIEKILSEVPEEKHAMLINMINKFTVTRLYEFLRNKKIEEVIVLFNEFAG